MGLFTNYAELGQRNFTKWRSLATDVFVQDSWKPTSALTVEGGVRWVYWPPWYSTTNNIANFDPRFFDPAQAAIINPSTGRLVGGARYNGMVLPGDGFEGDATQSVVAQDPAVLALFRGEPRGFSQTHANAFEPRLGAAYKFNEKTVLRLSTGVFHNRVTLNDSTLLGGNVPFQPQVTISNGSADNPGGGTVGSKDLPFTVTGQDAGVQAPHGLYVLGGHPARDSVRLHRGRELCRPQGVVSTAGTEPQPAAARDDSEQSRRQHRGPAALHGLRCHPALRERRALDLPQLPGQRRPALHQRAQGRLRVHAGQIGRQRQRQAERALEHLRRHGVLGSVEL